MGYVLAAYVIDRDAISQALGSGDRNLVAKIVKTNRAEFDDEEDFPAGAKAPPLRTALERLIDGSPDVSEHSQYRYALEELCRYLGKRVLADRYDFRSLGLERLFDQPWPFPVPNPGDFPHLAYVPPGEVEPELRRLDETDVASLGESARELAVEWSKCLKSAKRQRRGIILTYG